MHFRMRKNKETKDENELYSSTFYTLNAQHQLLRKEGRGTGKRIGDFTARVSAEKICEVTSQRECKEFLPSRKHKWKYCKKIEQVSVCPSSFFC